MRLLNSNKVEYLLVGGYAVAYYGYPRPTGNMDIWIARTPDNARKVVHALGEFGFTCSEGLLLEQKKVVRMGVPPFRLELLTTITGVDFPTCYAERLQVDLDEIEVTLISLPHLKLNKKASARSKDITDLDNLP